MGHGRSPIRASAPRHTTVTPKRSTQNSNTFSKQGLQLRRSVSEQLVANCNCEGPSPQLQVQSSHDLQTANRETPEILVSLKQVERFPHDGAIFCRLLTLPCGEFLCSPRPCQLASHPVPG